MNLEIANRLQQLRKEKGYSQEQLANELGISRQAVSKWERAESSPDTDNLICLARLYGVSLDELLNTEESTEDIIKNNNSDNEIEIINNCGEVEEKSDNFDNSIDYSDEFKPKASKKVLKICDTFQAIIPILTVITYLLLGFLLNLWHPGWIVFVLMPAVITFFDCFKMKKVTAFAYPCLVAAIFLFLGCVYKLWHPAWIIFLTIPLFYIIGSKFDK